jgi:hypothetical protein
VKNVNEQLKTNAMCESGGNRQIFTRKVMIEAFASFTKKVFFFTSSYTYFTGGS